MLSQRIQRYWDDWLNRRIKRAHSVVLNQSRIFIFPSRAGLGFCLLLLLMLLLAINYQNNLVFGLTFWLFSLLLVAIFHTYANLSGLQLQAAGVAPVYAGDSAHFELLLDGRGRARHALALAWRGQALDTVWLEAEQPLRVSLSLRVEQRGLYQPPRLRLESHFPLGLIRAWTWVALDWRCLVYPAPRWAGELPPSPGDTQDEHSAAMPWGDDFAGFHPYQPGDPLRRANWKAYAKEQPLMIKEYSQSMETEILLDWDLLEGLSVEQRLSGLCAWALDCERKQLPYALRLPGIAVALGRGDAHVAEVLRHLALYGEDSETENGAAAKRRQQ